MSGPRGINCSPFRSQLKPLRRYAAWLGGSLLAQERRSGQGPGPEDFFVRMWSGGQP